MLQLEMVLLSLPVEIAADPNQIFPPFVAFAIVADPNMEQFVIRFIVASAWNRIVLVPDVLDVDVFEIVSEFPPVFRPSTVTLSAPLKSIIGPPLKEPLMVRGEPPEG